MIPDRVSPPVRANIRTVMSQTKWGPNITRLSERDVSGSGPNRGSGARTCAKLTRNGVSTSRIARIGRVPGRAGCDGHIGDGKERRAEGLAGGGGETGKRYQH